MTPKIQNSFIQAYIDLNKTLIKTLIIKSKFAVYATNQDLIAKYGKSAVNLSDQQSWKYYKNLAGEYHHTDIPMEVISLDTREPIIFDAKTLVRHTATAVGYRYGTRYYHALVREFPNQEFLIQCILNPCEKEKAIAADDGDILSYPPELVESTETTLIIELESFIKLFQARWFVQAFSLTDPYYAVVQRAVLALQLLPKLLNLRSKRCKTDEVHSFHLREYLASHHRLDRWLPYMTREQSLWLYRNIRYLQRNAGTVDNFNTLLVNVLDKRHIPVSEYSIRQLSSFDSEGYPVVQARRKQKGTAAPASQVPYIPLDVFFEKEIKTTFGNKRFFELAEKNIKRKLLTSPSAVMQTKDLESAMVDLSDCVPDPLTDVMLRQLVSMTHQGLYNVSINFQDPKTFETNSLSARDTVMYMLYLTCKMDNIPFDVLPETANVKFRLHPRPRVEELTRLIEPGMEWLKPVAAELVKNQPVLSECFSVTMFYNMTYQIYEECLKHWYLLADTHDLYTRGVVEQMTLKLFGSCLRDFGNGELVETWRVRNNLPVFNRTYDESLALFKELFERSTGFRIDETKKLRNIQNALLSLFETLSSYSIRFIREINDGRLLMTNGSSIRLGSITEIARDITKVGVGTHVIKAAGLVKDQNYIQSQLDESITALESPIVDKITLTVRTTLNPYNIETENCMVYHKADNLFTTIYISDPVTGEIKNYPNLSLDKLLTQTQLKALKIIGD